jgi:hypothetical protein
MLTVAQRRILRMRLKGSPRALLMNSRREFIGTTAAAGALLALAPGLKASNRHHPGRSEQRTLFFDLTHEAHQGHTYHLVMGAQRYELQHCHRSHPALLKARRQNGFIEMLPDGVLTHVVENIPMPPGVQLSYLMKDPDTSSGTWGMSAIYLLPPKSAYSYAYTQARARTSAGQPLVLSAKRRKYGLPAASSLQDLMDEQDVIDTTEWAAALVNLHPELLCADPATAAHIQTNHIHAYPSTGQLAQVLGIAGTALPAQSVTSDNQTGWATLMPYTDDDGVTPLKSTAGNNKGLILYSAKWQPAINVPWIAAAMTPATQGVKNDTTLGADVTSGRGSLFDSDLTGKIWCRNDGVTSVTQAPGSAVIEQPANPNFVLSNITPNFSGYSLTSSNSDSGGQFNIDLKFKNWYLRWLGLYIQFHNSTGIVPVNQLPALGEFPGLNTANEIFIGTLTPEFTIFGIPVQSSGNTFSFPFPTNASSAVILASGLGYGADLYHDTDLIGEVMTSLFNLSIPALLIAFGLGATVDAFGKTVVVPSLNLFFTEIAARDTGATLTQILTILWRSIVKGLANPSGPLKDFSIRMAKFFADAEVTEAIEDAIPLVDAILQAIGALGALAEITETSCEVVLSPKTYAYQLVGTYDLSVGLKPAANNFPAAAATYKVTAVFDNGTPHVQTLNMPGGTTKQLPDVVFPGVPLGGTLTVTVGFYAADGANAGQGTHVGHGATGPIANEPPRDPASAPVITVTEDRLPLGPGVMYMHKQRTMLDTQGNRAWHCGSAPVAPVTPSSCEPNPGNLCAFRNITFNSSMGYIGYGWESYNTQGCVSGAGQFDQLANIANANGPGGNAQTGYAASPCGLQGAAKLVYDPLGRPDVNFYLDTTNNLNMLRQVHLNPPKITDPRAAQQSWGKFNLSPDDLLLHPSGAVITLNSVTSRIESLKLPTAAVSDSEAAVNLIANLHGGLGDRPGVFNNPTVAAITAEGTILIVEKGNNRIHAIDASANPVPLFTKQSQKYFFPFSATGGASTQYLDIAVEFTGFIYVLSTNNSVYRLDIYHPDQSGTNPITTTMGFNAAKVTVDYWRNVYSLNYEVLMINGAIPPSGITEPSVSQWLPITPPPCDGQVSAPRPPQPPRQHHTRHNPRRPLRRDFWKSRYGSDR